ncbi:MAG: alpha-N-arabinofuranosidase [Verrucomicrobia bacterium]|nr:alpha-N-arabinofuranosidase [Verrucomicrobiota bacterium]
MPLASARVALHPDIVIGTIDPRLYGSFIEHLGRAVYNGIYEPGHPQADANGFRQDVLALIRELNVPIVRYPGGNFVSGYRWEDGVGPHSDRPRRLDPAWRTIETNQFGTDEFMRWCKAANTEAMMAVNLGTRGMAEAAALLEYCNVPGGTAWSDLRRKNGAAEPYRVKTWCLGNEMDGPWQMGHKTADEYGRLAAETGRLMKMIDPSLELVACGSSGNSLPTFAGWDARVLELTHDVADYLSLHTYLGKGDGWGSATLRTWGEYQAQPLNMEWHIRSIIATCDHVQAKLKSKKKLMLSFDEWNVWWHSNSPTYPKFADWSIAPAQLEDNYTHEDALVMGSMMLSLLRHADRVRMACLAQLVNVIAPILTRNGGPAWKQTIFWPYLHGSLYGRGESLHVAIDSPVYDSKEFGPVPYLDAVATRDPAANTLTLFAINRAEKDTLPLAADLRLLAPTARIIEHLVLESADSQARNTEAAPRAVEPHKRGTAKLESGRLSAQLAPASWNVIRIQL